MVRRTNPKMSVSADAVFTETEIAILNHLAGDPEQPASKNVAHYVLADIHLGVEMRKQLVGN